MGNVQALLFLRILLLSRQNAVWCFNGINLHNIENTGKPGICNTLKKIMEKNNKKNREDGCFTKDFTGIEM